jgi:AcrR family transcriptional regulator
MPRRTKDDALLTRRAILAAAERVFYKYGVARTSMQQVADAAKVTRGAIYWHFTDKLSLLEAMVDDVMLPQEDMLASLAQGETRQPLADLHLACLGAFRHIAQDRKRQRVMTIITHRCEHVEDLAPLSKRRQQCKEDLLQQFKQILAKAEHNGELSRDWTAPVAARALQALMTGLIMNSLENRKASYFEDAEQTINAFFKSLRR